MRKTLRVLCLGIAAAFSAISFAQTNVTDKLINPDAELGMLGWDVTFVDGGQIWNKQTKGEEKAPGYYGFNNWAFENWRNSSAGLTNSSIYQVVKDLPNGTYVFGAYAMATRDAWTPSIDDIEGVSIFANEQSLRVATHRVEGMGEKWAHSIKFNVATTVTDGTLTVGMRTEETTASFVAMDNATLWFFKDMSHEDALEEMAKIDIANTVAKISPYLEAGKMNADTLAFLQSAIDAAATVSAETAGMIEEDLYWGKRLAVKSIAAYAKLAAALEAAKAIAAKEWSNYDETVVALEALNELIAACDEKYEAGTALNAEAEAWAAPLLEAAALVELDAYYVKADEYYEAIDTLTLGEEIGEYAYADYDRAVGYYEEIIEILYTASSGELSATSAQSQCDALFAKIQNIFDNPINYSEFPIFLHRCDTLLPGQGPEDNKGGRAYAVLDGAFVQDIPAGIDNNGNSYAALSNVCHYNSRLFRFREPLKKVRFIVHEVGADFQTATDGRASFLLGSFTMFDENGDTIPLVANSTIVTNANEPREGGGVPALLDGNPRTYFHSLWSGATPQAHYLEVTLPEGEYTAFSFQMVALSNNHTRPFPAEMELTYVSDLVTELQQTIVSARTLNPLFGTAPGFTNMDPTYYANILAEGDAMVAKEGASDSEIQATIDKVKAAMEQAKSSFVLPEAGKKYRIISGENRFFTNQNIMKALTLHTDTIYGDWLWWETAHPDSARQEFILEPCETTTDRLYYTFKHVQTGLYLSELLDTLGNLVPNRFVFTERRDSFYLKNLGQGQFGIMASDGNSRRQLNMEFHNNGVWSDTEKNYGAILGVKSYIHTWDSQANQSSAWFFREMVELPQAAKSISELNFRSEAISIYEGVNNLSITADKDCAFADLSIYDVFGNIVAIDQLSVKGNVATLKLAKNVETFSVSFTNDEGIAEVSIDGYLTGAVSAAYTKLQSTYNTVLAIAPVEGINVGQVSDLSAYNDALAIAEGLLAEGGEDAEFEAATAALEAAQAGIVYNLPKADTDYLMLIGLDAIRTNHLTDMAIFADDDEANPRPRWTYVSLTNDAFRWRFIDCGELKNGREAYYIQNVATGMYPAVTAENSPMALVNDTTETHPFNIFLLEKSKVSLGDSFWNDGQQSFHPMSHGSGAAANKGGYMISYRRTDPASTLYVVEADIYINDILVALDIENIDVADEYVAPAVKGTFDLFGRRIESPVTTGIYIVDGEKKVIEK